MEQQLQGKVAIVTGGCAGIGLACAETLARAGAAVSICDLDESSVEQTARDLQAYGQPSLGLVCDVSSAAAVADLFTDTAAQLGPVDIVVNNAGIGAPLTPLGDTEEEEFDRIIAVNLKGVWLCMREAIRAMEPRKTGTIINMASALSITTYPGSGLYTASKHAVGGITKSAAVEYGPAGIRINAICPGFVSTPLLRSAVTPDVIEQMALVHPMNRLGTPEEIADAVLYLASDAASFITGTLLSVDGGWTAT